MTLRLSVRARPPTALLALFLLLGAPGDAPAQEAGEAATPGALTPEPSGFQLSERFDDPEMEAQVRRLAAQLRCPTCQALSIADSPSELSHQMKAVIRDRLREGMTPEEVRQHFVAAYGEWILLSPEPAGFNLLVYVLPFAALLLGFVILALGVRRWIAQAPPLADGEDGDSEEDAVHPVASSARGS